MKNDDFENTKILIYKILHKTKLTLVVQNQYFELNGNTLILSIDCSAFCEIEELIQTLIMKFGCDTLFNELLPQEYHFRFSCH